jgi:hypothetical protein
MKFNIYADMIDYYSNQNLITFVLSIRSFRLTSIPLSFQEI